MSSSAVDKGLIICKYFLLSKYSEVSNKRLRSNERFRVKSLTEILKNMAIIMKCDKLLDYLAKLCMISSRKAMNIMKN